FLLSAISLFVVYHFGPMNPYGLLSGPMAAILLILLFFLCIPCGEMGFIRNASTLVPRLAAAIGVGYLFFFSASDLLKILVNARDVKVNLGASFLIVLFVFGYLCIAVQRRIYPKLSTRNLISRALPLFSLALSYSLCGSVFCQRFLIELTETPQPSWQAKSIYASQGILTLAIAMAIGIVLQLFWEDKPVTDPL
ncbi:hypothetical protein JW992_16485, partial [candidate division KSB1 bacterium]|nr:hypothetical protein [candidate division KSB1 bacterium]